MFATGSGSDSIPNLIDGLFSPGQLQDTRTGNSIVADRQNEASEESSEREAFEELSQRMHLADTSSELSLQFEIDQRDSELTKFNRESNSKLDSESDESQSHEFDLLDQAFAEFV